MERVLWGSDYPHGEGTWLYEGGGEPERPTVTQLSLAHTFAAAKEVDVRKIVGENAVTCYGLHRDAVRRVAERVGPTTAELTSRPDLGLVPDRYTGLGFRIKGTWA